MKWNLADNNGGQYGSIRGEYVAYCDFGWDTETDEEYLFWENLLTGEVHKLDECEDIDDAMEAAEAYFGVNRVGTVDYGC
jgi:hypothetical protein